MTGEGMGTRFHTAWGLSVGKRHAHKFPFEVQIAARFFETATRLTVVPVSSASSSGKGGGILASCTVSSPHANSCPVFDTVRTTPSTHATFLARFPSGRVGSHVPESVPSPPPFAWHSQVNTPPLLVQTATRWPPQDAPTITVLLRCSREGDACAALLPPPHMNKPGHRFCG